MQIIKTIKEMQALSQNLTAEDRTIGCVPTMGALHDGHLSLVERSKKENDVTVVSIFVNPTQFGPEEDFGQYPRDMQADLDKLSALNVDVVFTPDTKAMYPEGTLASINVGYIGEILCGASRPGHFNGVATVVAKLFNAVMPHRAYFGQKDFQQTVIIRRLIKEQGFDINIVTCPIIREPDGLAISSRNRYLSAEQRKTAVILYKALKHGEGLINEGMTDISQVKKEMEEVVRSEPLANIDYVAIVDPESLEPMREINTPVVICIAVKIGAARLIDNIIV